MYTFLHYAVNQTAASFTHVLVLIMLNYCVYLMALMHQADIHPSGGAGPLLSLRSRPL